MSLRREWLKNNGKYHEGLIKFTKATRFVMPMIGYFMDDFTSEDGKYNYLINCYLDTESDHIVIVLDNTNDPDIIELLNNNEKNNYYEGSTSEDGDREIVLRYRVPEKRLNDYRVFLSSKYSKMSKEYKEWLVNYYGKQSYTKDYRPSEFDVLYPSPFKKKQWADHLGVDISLIDEVGEVFGEVDMNYEEYKTIEQLTSQLTNKDTGVKI